MIDARKTLWILVALIFQVLGGCSSISAGIGVSDLLALREPQLDQRLAIEGVVSINNGFCIADLHDGNKFMPMAIPVHMLNHVKSLLGREVVVDGQLQAHKLEERANSFEFSPTQLLISRIRLKSDEK